MSNLENADLLTNAAAALERYRAEEASLELEISILQARLELTREFVAALAGKPRLRRARTAKLIELGEGRSNVPEPAPEQPELVA